MVPTTVMTSTLVNVAQLAANCVTYFLAFTMVLPMSPKVSMDKEALMKAHRAKYDENYPKFETTIKPLLSFVVGTIIGVSHIYVRI